MPPLRAWWWVAAAALATAPAASAWLLPGSHAILHPRASCDHAAAGQPTRVPGTSLGAQTSFSSSAEYIAHLSTVSKLPRGFSVGASRFKFQPYEVANKQLPMNLTLILLDQPTDSFACKFTKNKFCGGPILVGRERLRATSLQAVLVNNKISNVCPNGLSDFGHGDSDKLCQDVASLCHLSSKEQVLPSSTGIIGWRLPLESMQRALPNTVAALQKDSILPAALGIMTTDRYPKVRRFDAPQGWSIVGVAKGAGMIEPNMATMLSYVLTDLDVPRAELQALLDEVTEDTFNSISVDGDQSTSDTVAVLSSGVVAPASDEERAAFRRGLRQVCQQLSEDIVRNGEGIQHVVRVTVRGVPDADAHVAKAMGKSILNSNLVKCAIAGNDPNVGRIVGAIGSCLSKIDEQYARDFSKRGMAVSLGGLRIFAEGRFDLTPAREEQLFQYMRHCQLFDPAIAEHDRTFPPHDRCVELVVEMEDGDSTARPVIVVGGDLTKEYVEVNADYRS